MLGKLRKFGTLGKLGKYSFSQGVVTRNNRVVAIEGKGGTQTMLQRCKSKKLRRKEKIASFVKISSTYIKGFIILIQRKCTNCGSNLCSGN